MKSPVFLASALLLGSALHASDDSESGPRASNPGRQHALGALEGLVLLDGGPLSEWDSVTNAIIYLVGDALDSATALPDARQAPVLEQRDFTFLPHVLALTAGTELTISNRDTVTHNIHTYTKGRRRRTAFNRAQNANTTMTATFSRPDSVLVLCDIHSYMEAHILVLPNPFFTKPAEDGAYIITGIPPGTYELVAWHKYYAARREVEVVSGETTRADIDLAADP